MNCKLISTLALASALFLTGGGRAYADSVADPTPDPSPTMTIDDWCPVRTTDYATGNCLAGPTKWSCHTASTQPWCCVRKEITYTCGGGAVVATCVWQWNKSNASCSSDQQSCVSSGTVVTDPTQPVSSD